MKEKLTKVMSILVYRFLQKIMENILAMLSTNNVEFHVKSYVCVLASWSVDYFLSVVTQKSRFFS